jgi:hypothetical protein
MTDITTPTLVPPVIHPVPPRKDQRVDEYVAKGYHPDIASIYAGFTAPERHEWRVREAMAHMVFSHTPDSSKEELSKVVGEICDAAASCHCDQKEAERMGDEGHPGSPDWEEAAKAVAQQGILDVVGTGGRLDLEGKSTARIPSLRGLGKGRKNATDGGAWDSAIGEATLRALTALAWAHKGWSSQMFSIYPVDIIGEVWSEDSDGETHLSVRDQAYDTDPCVSLDYGPAWDTACWVKALITLGSLRGEDMIGDTLKGVSLYERLPPWITLQGDPKEWSQNMGVFGTGCRY